MTQRMMHNKFFLLIALMIALTGCATTEHVNNSDQNTDSDQASVDPYEGFNRGVFRFNDGVDTYFLKPVTKGYQYITPNFIEKGVSNFFSNLLEIRNALNAVLQGKGSDAANYTGRFIFNSTIGVAGLFDVASKMGIEKTDGEDFGQTLGAWGVDSGAYIVLPFLGPSTVRDGVGLPVDMYMDPVNYAEESSTRMGLGLLKVVDIRSKLLKSEDLLSGDRYVFIRDAYLQRREYLVEDGEVTDNFGDDTEYNF